MAQVESRAGEFTDQCSERGETRTYRGHRISVIIPCYNEEQGLAWVLQQVPEHVDEILVLDNCSSDATVAVARAGGDRVRVLCHPTNLGYGGSYLRGLKAASGDIVVTTDGDGTYPVAECLGLVDTLIDCDYEFLSCARFPLSDPACMSPRNRFGNWVLNSIVELLYGVALNDAQSGMWVLRSRILDGFDLHSRGMAFSDEIKIEAFTRLGPKAGEVGIAYTERIGRSKLFPFRDGLRMVAYLLKRRLFGPRRAAGPVPHDAARPSFFLSDLPGGDAGGIIDLREATSRLGVA